MTRNRLEILRAVVPLGSGFIAWEVAAQWADFRFLPPFSRVARAAVELTLSGQILGPLASGLLSLAVGYGAAVVLGLALGAAMGRYRTVELTLSPFLNASLAAPKIALVPVFYAVFGLSRWIQVAVIFLSSFFVIVLNTMRGIQAVDPACLEMARGFGATEMQLFRRVLLPGGLPLAMAGLRLAIGHAVRSMVTAEMVVALFGLGALLRSYGGRFDAERLFGVLLVVVLVALGCSHLVRIVERRLTGWADSNA